MVYIVYFFATVVAEKIELMVCFTKKIKFSTYFLIKTLTKHYKQHYILIYGFKNPKIISKPKTKNLIKIGFVFLGNFKVKKLNVSSPH